MAIGHMQEIQIFISNIQIFIQIFKFKPSFSQSVTSKYEKKWKKHKIYVL